MTCIEVNVYTYLSGFTLRIIIVIILTIIIMPVVFFLKYSVILHVTVAPAEHCQQCSQVTLYYVIT